MNKILYIDACIKREDHSRTEKLAQAYLKTLLSKNNSVLETIVLENAHILPLNESSLEKREAKISANDFSDPCFDFAKKLIDADELVIAAPYWDMSFPSILKIFLENICVRNLTFHYNAQGIPCGLINIKSVTYITTAGGYIGESNFGFDYIKGLFSALFSIRNFSCFSAEGLDIYGNNPEQILLDAINRQTNT